MSSTNIHRDKQYTDFSKYDLDENKQLAIGRKFRKLILLLVVITPLITYIIAVITFGLVGFWLIKG